MKLKTINTLVLFLAACSSNATRFDAANKITSGFSNANKITSGSSDANRVNYDRFRWTRMVQACIVDHNLSSIQGYMPVEECKQRCLWNENCCSIEWHELVGRCTLGYAKRSTCKGAWCYRAPCYRYPQHAWYMELLDRCQTMPTITQATAARTGSYCVDAHQALGVPPGVQPMGYQRRLLRAGF